MDIEAAKKEMAEIDGILKRGFKVLGREESLRLINRRSALSTIISDQEYLSLAFEDRVKWWAGATHRSMRMQAESGADQLLLFDKGWYEHAAKREPRMLDVLDPVCDRLAIPFGVVKRLIEHDVASTEWKTIRAELPNVDYV